MVMVMLLLLVLLVMVMVHRLLLLLVMLVFAVGGRWPVVDEVVGQVERLELVAAQLLICSLREARLGTSCRRVKLGLLVLRRHHVVGLIQLLARGAVHLDGAEGVGGLVMRRRVSRKESAIVHHCRWRLLRRCKWFRNAHLWHHMMLGHQRWKLLLLMLLLFRRSVVAKATHRRRATGVNHEVGPPKLLATVAAGEAARPPAALMIVDGARERPRASFFDSVDTAHRILIVKGRHCHGRRWNENALSISMMIHVHQVLVLI